LLERQTGAYLQLSARRRCLSDRTELGRVHKTIGSPEIRVVHSVERLAAKLDTRQFANPERAHERKVEGLDAGSVHAVARRVAVGERSGCGKGSGVEPLHRIVRAGAEYGLTSGVRPNRILAEYRARVRGIAEDGDRKREATLDLVQRG